MTTSGTRLLTSQTPTSPHLARLVWLGEQLVHDDGVVADLTGEEFAAMRAAAATARTAGGDLVLIATAAHHRAANPPSSAEDAPRP